MEVEIESPLTDVYLCPPGCVEYSALGGCWWSLDDDECIPVMLHSAEPLAIGMTFLFDGQTWRIADQGGGWICEAVVQ